MSDGRRWRAYDPETGTHLGTGVEPEPPPEGARVVYDAPETDHPTEDVTECAP